MIEPNFLIAFGVGVLSFLSPCILPVLPGYFFYLSSKRSKVLVTSASFVLGFSLVLVILGAAASAAGQLLLGHISFWQKIGGFLIVVFGLQTMGVFKGFAGFGEFFEKRLGRGGPFLAGVSFGLSWTPCIGPILGSILVLASQTQTLIRGVGLLVSYALGLGIPMVLSGFFLTRLRIFHNQYVSLLSGAVLITLGLLLFFGWYSKLTIWTEQVYRFLGIPVL